MSQKGLNNPVLLTKVASELDVKKAQSQLSTVVGTLFVLGLGYVGYTQLKKLRKRKFLEENLNNPDTIAAMVMYKSMHRISSPKLFGITLFNVPDGTDEVALNRIAAQVSNLKNVQIAYRILFDRSLADDINSDLSTSEMQSFYNSINFNNQITENNYVTGTPLYVNNPSGTIVYDEQGNYIVRREKGHFLGYVIEVVGNRYKYDRNWNIYDGYVDKNDVISQNPG